MKTARDWSLAFLEAVRATPRNLAQSRLLNTADRDLGAILFPLEEGERAEVYSLLSPAKVERLKAEAPRMARVKLNADNLGIIAGHLMAHLSADRPLGPASRYFRPQRSPEQE